MKLIAGIKKKKRVVIGIIGLLLLTALVIIAVNMLDKVNRQMGIQWKISKYISLNAWYNNSLSDKDKQILTRVFIPMLRKILHFLTYFGSSFIAILLLGRKKNISMAKRMLFVVGVFAFCASADEFAQYAHIIPNRNGYVQDVIVDICGAITGCSAGYVFMKVIRVIKRNIKLFWTKRRKSV